MSIGFVNTFAGNPLDRAGDRRRNPDWLQARFGASQTRVLACWKGDALLDADNRLATLDSDFAGELDPDGERRLFLGLDSAGHAVFAIDLEGEPDPASGVLTGRGKFVGLREAAVDLEREDAAMAACARAVFFWRRTMRLCPSCGGPLTNADGGWKRVCDICGTEHFPRTDPVVIMLPVRDERCLLGRQSAWPAGRFSALAGFMEPGESIEEACAREIAEECGLETLKVSYHSSQPWPFPFNLMIGLFAEVTNGPAEPDQSELEAVRWTTRAEARAALAAASDSEFSLPPPLAIAHSLIWTWARE